MNNRQFSQICISPDGRELPALATLVSPYMGERRQGFTCKGQQKHFSVEALFEYLHLSEISMINSQFHDTLGTGDDG